MILERIDSLQTGLTDGTNMNGCSFALAGDYGRGLQVLMRVMGGSEALKINNRPRRGCSGLVVCDGNTGDVLMLLGQC